MDKTKLLKSLYTVGGLLLGGALWVHIVPDQFNVPANSVMVYLVMHSWFPSAKTGSPQG